MLASAGIAFCSCQDEPAAEYNPVQHGSLVQGKVVPASIEPYADGRMDGTFTRRNFTLYDKKAQTGGKWVAQTELLIGYSLSVPSRFVFEDGCAWEEIMTFSSSTGPTAFGTALDAVNRKLYKKYTPLIGRKLSFDPVRNTLTVGKTSYRVMAADQKGFVLAFTSDYITSGGNGGQYLETGSYEPAAQVNFDGESYLRFDSETEAYDWLIDLFRDTFGEEVNLNTLYNGVILDNPYFNISALESERDRL